MELYTVRSHGHRHGRRSVRERDAEGLIFQLSGGRKPDGFLAGAMGPKQTYGFLTGLDRFGSAAARGPATMQPAVPTGCVGTYPARQVC